MKREARKAFSPWWLNAGYCTWWSFVLGCYFVYPLLLIKTWLPILVSCGGCAPQPFVSPLIFVYNG
jgi:hypothetical protein